MDLAFVIDRLKTQLQGVRTVGGAADMDAAMAGTVAVPAAFVIPLDEEASPSESTMVTRQRIAHGFGVVVGVINRRDATGAASMGALAPIRAALMQALIGWVHDAGDGEPVQFRRGKLLRLDGDGRLWWVDEFFFLSTYRSN